jgi:hypothetical protein
MNAMLNINYDLINDNNNILSEFEKICKDSYSNVYVKIRLYFLLAKTKGMVRKMVKFQDNFVKNIYRYDFSSIKQFQEKTQETYAILDSRMDLCKTCKYYPICGDVIRNDFYLPLKASLGKTLNVIELSYHIDGFEFTDKEYTEHSKSLEEFSDIWDYDNSEEEEKLVFEHNIRYHN